MEKLIRITESQLKRLIVENTEMEEMLGYESFHSDEGLQDLRDAIDKNKTVSVAFVKKDGTVRHMAIRKSLSSYVGSDREKTDAQMNVEQNHNLKKVVDINAYIRAKREMGDPAEAAKKCWRSINLQNVLGFLVGGKFKDLREENEIMDRFGEGVYNSLTKSMVNAMDRERQENEAQIEEIVNEGLMDRLFGSPSVTDAAKDALRSQGHSQIGKDDEKELYVVFNGEKFYPSDIEYADNYDMGEIPRVENGKLIVANPMWRE